MKLHSLINATALALIAATGFSTPVQAQAPDPCSMYLCMAGMSGQGTSGPECAAPIAAFHMIQVWSPWFNPPATAMARQNYMMACPNAAVGTNAAIMASIIATWGYTP